MGKTKRGKGTKVMAIADGGGLPLALYAVSASPHEVTLVHDTLDATFGFDLPRRLIGDRAYDSDQLDKELRALGVELIAPNRRNRRRTQDGRPLRRYKRRWRVERLFAWLFTWRRLNTRWEVNSTTFWAWCSWRPCVSWCGAWSGHPHTNAFNSGRHPW